MGKYQMFARGFMAIAGAACLWGCLGPFSKLAFSQGMDPLEVAFWRALFGWIFFAVQSVWKHEYSIDHHDLPVIAGFGFLGVTVFFGSYQIAVQTGGAALASVLLYTAPAWVALLARLVLKETLSVLKIFCIGLTIVGVAAVALGSPSSQAIAINAMALTTGLIAGLSYAFYYIFGKHYLCKYPTHTVFAYTLPVGVLGLYPWIDFHPLTWIGFFAVLFLGLATTFAAYTLYAIGLRRLDASKAAVTATLEPVVAALLAYVWWGERFTLLGYVGVIIILSTVLLLIWNDRRQHSKNSFAHQ